MQFRNKSDDVRELSLDGVSLITVPVGEAVVVTAEEAPGFVLQCGPDGAWEPADDEGTAAVTAALAAAAEDALAADEPAVQTRKKRTKPNTTTTEESA